MTVIKKQKVKKVKTLLLFRKELISQIHSAATTEGLSYSVWVEQAVMAKLGLECSASLAAERTLKRTKAHAV